MVGALTTLVVGGIGVSLYASGSTGLAVFALVLAAYRGFFVLRGVWAWVTPDDEEEDD